MLFGGALLRVEADHRRLKGLGVPVEEVPRRGITPIALDTGNREVVCGGGSSASTLAIVATLREADIAT
jgi:hypothetical protein